MSEEDIGTPTSGEGEPFQPPTEEETAVARRTSSPLITPRTSQRISSNKRRDIQPEEDESTKTLDRDDFPSRRSQNTFSYDNFVELAGEGANFATAAQLASLNRRNEVLVQSIEKLEDKLFDEEDQRMALQRDLLIAEEESADYRTLIEQRESQNVQLRKEIDQLGLKLQNEASRFNEVDNERRKLEHKQALLQAEVDVNARAQAKLEQTLAEIENLKQKLTSMITEKGELDQQVNQRQKEVSELERKLHSEALRSRQINNSTVTNLEGIIETERKRAQQAIDYVRQTLKAKIRVLEAQVEADRESDTNIKNEKREVARELKQVMRKLDEKKSQVGRDKRKLETLAKQVESLKESLNKVNAETSSLESKQHSLKREVGTLSTQVEAASYSNAKLNVLIPNQIRLAIEEEATNKMTKGSKDLKPEKTDIIPDDAHVDSGVYDIRGDQKNKKVEEGLEGEEGSGGPPPTEEVQLEFDTRPDLNI